MKILMAILVIIFAYSVFQCVPLSSITVGGEHVVQNTPKMLFHCEAPVASQLPTKYSRSSKSEVGIHVFSIGRNLDGSISAAGTVWFAAGLLLRINNNQITTSTLPEVTVIRDVIFTSSQTGLILADGKLYFTKDGGNRWQQAEVGSNRYFNKLHFSNELNGWAVGRDGIIYSTQDGGETWHKEKSNTTTELKHVMSIDGIHVWALGAQTLISSRNSGLTWETFELPYLIISVVFVTRFQGWGVDLNGNILETADGGKTWMVNRSGEGETLRSIFFTNERHGWIAGSKVLGTNNAGNTWDVLTNSELPAQIHQVIFIDGTSAWAVGEDWNLYHTKNNGKTWQSASDKWKNKVADEVYNTKFKQRR